MGIHLSEPAPGKSNLTAKNRVWGFFANPNRTRPANRRNPQQPRRKNRPVLTKTASGIPYWPSRDPIEETGGINLYGFIDNDGIGQIDILGMMPSVGEYEPKCPEGWVEYDRPTPQDFGYSDSTSEWSRWIGSWASPVIRRARQAVRFRFVEIGAGAFRQIGTCHQELTLNNSVSWGKTKSFNLGAEFGYKNIVTVTGSGTFEWHEGAELGGGVTLGGEKCNRWMGIPMILRARWGTEWQSRHTINVEPDRFWMQDYDEVYLNFGWLVCKKECDKKKEDSK